MSPTWQGVNTASVPALAARRPWESGIGAGLAPTQSQRTVAGVDSDNDKTNHHLHPVNRIAHIVTNTASSAIQVSSHTYIHRDHS